MATLHEDLFTFLIISRLFHLRIRNVSDKNCRENQNTHLMFGKFFFFANRTTIYEIMLKNIVEPGRPQMTVWRMRSARQIPKATDAYSEYVILIAFPLQQWLSERASLPRCTYIACVVRVKYIVVASIVIINGGYC